MYWDPLGVDTYASVPCIHRRRPKLGKILGHWVGDEEVGWKGAAVYC